MRLYLDTIKSIAPDAQIGFTGSLDCGTKGPHKDNLPFDPASFDVDAFIVSDELAAQFPSNKWFRSGNDIPHLKPVQDQIGSVLRQDNPGLREEAFTFRIFTCDEFTRKVGPDEQFFIN